MPLALHARQIALLILAALYPALAFALDQTYEGLLLPDNRDPSIPIVVELREVGTFLKGSVKTSTPLKGNAPIESGSNVSGSCKINVVLNNTVNLVLRGKCEDATFNGYYTAFDTKKRISSNGSFHLTRKVPEAAKSDGSRGTTSSATTATACMKANTQCLAACPRGDSSIELMCASHCRTKFRTCKGQIRKLPAETE